MYAAKKKKSIFLSTAPFAVHFPYSILLNPCNALIWTVINKEMGG